MCKISWTLGTCALLVGALAVWAASAQDSTQRPGEPTQARVWVQNQGIAQAVPVRIEDVADLQPLRVQLSEDATVTVGAGSTVQSRAVRQRWEYLDLVIDSGEDPAAILNTAGADGWEATGITLARQAQTIIVLKRPL